MRVLAFNCSPKMGRGTTAMILNPFLDGMRDSGADVDLIYLRKLEIKPCNGDFSCWTRHPGECAINDDMNTLYPKIREADLVVYATPVYCDGMAGPMKNLLDRMIPLGQPFVEIRDGHTRHIHSEEARRQRVVLVSVCGLWEMDNFDTLVAHMRAFCKNGGNRFAGALLRPHAEVMRHLIEAGAPIDHVFEAAREAGRQLVEEGFMAEETTRSVGAELLSVERYVEGANGAFREMIGAMKR